MIISRENERGDTPWMITNGSSTEAVQELCISPAEILSWRDKYVLEIGIGGGAVFKTLKEAGFKHLYGLEPSLKFPNGRQLLQRFLRDNLRGIYPIRAVDIKDIPLPNNREFDIVFANGVNFQNYFHSEAEFLTQLSGILAALHPEGKVIFSINMVSEKGEAIITNIVSNHMHNAPYIKINLSKLLTDIGCTYEIRKKKKNASVIITNAPQALQHLLQKIRTAR